MGYPQTVQQGQVKRAGEAASTSNSLGFCPSFTNVIFIRLVGIPGSLTLTSYSACKTPGHYLLEARDLKLLQCRAVGGEVLPA